MKHAVALRRFTLNDNGYLLGAVILNMADNQFEDLVACELVREATAAEVQAVQPAAEESAPKASKPRRKSASSPSAPADPAPAVESNAEVDPPAA